MLLLVWVWVWVCCSQGMTFWWIVVSSTLIAFLMLIMQIEFLSHATAAHDYALTLMVAIMSAIATIGTSALGVGRRPSGQGTRGWLVTASARASCLLGSQRRPSPLRKGNHCWVY